MNKFNIIQIKTRKCCIFNIEKAVTTVNVASKMLEFLLTLKLYQKEKTERIWECLHFMLNNLINSIVMGLELI